MKRSELFLIVFIICCTVPPVLSVVYEMSSSMEEELTGLSFYLDEVAFFDETGIRGEGRRIWIYRIPEKAAERLSAKDYPLAKYPTWTPLAFDGYKRIQWRPALDANSGDVALVLRLAFDEDAAAIEDTGGGGRLDEGIRLARALTKRDGTLISGSYTIANEDMVTNYFLYVMNLDERVLVKLSLLT